MISKVLVANRGEIARRIFRTCREMGISTVAVYSEADAGEPHTREADEAVLLEGHSPVETYLDIDTVITAAKESGADAVHPGYGFLSENASFARAVITAGVTWIGPSPRAIEIMGSKLESKRLMTETGVPTLPSVELEGLDSINSAALSLGYPVLVKASAGGGGKGMRIVSSPSELGEALESAAREAEAAFGDGTVFLEKYLTAPRHVEIQVFGDTSGNVVSLHERECSIQRRHQKIIEEAPSAAIDQITRRAMGEAAVAAAHAVDYVGAGTVEFLYQDGQFYFLEMNTRLQVEHPVTEMVTGLDLVRLQLEIAGGDTLPDKGPRIEGHAIEARLYAEDPRHDYLPVTGRFNRFRFPDVEGLRVDAGIEDGSTVTVHYDPMVAKVIAHGPTREAATAIPPVPCAGHRSTARPPIGRSWSGYWSIRSSSRARPTPISSSAMTPPNWDALSSISPASGLPPWRRPWRIRPWPVSRARFFAPSLRAGETRRANCSEGPSAVSTGYTRSTTPCCVPSGSRAWAPSRCALPSQNGQGLPSATTSICSRSPDMTTSATSTHRWARPRSLPSIGSLQSLERTTQGRCTPRCRAR
jgi:biotin carboxylase